MATAARTVNSDRVDLGSGNMAGIGGSWYLGTSCDCEIDCKVESKSGVSEEVEVDEGRTIPNNSENCGSAFCWLTTVSPT